MVGCRLSRLLLTLPFRTTIIVGTTALGLVGSAALFAEDRPRAALYVQPATVKAWLDADLPVTFLDVRWADEFEAGHLPGAIQVKHDEVLALADQLPTDRPIVLYCIHSAHRAPAAVKTLQQAGFRNALVLEGGITAWRAGGMTIRASDLAKEPTIWPVTNRCAELAKPGERVTDRIVQ